jgi:hypothetical protein
VSALAAELDGIALGDQRLNRRARRVLAALGDKPTQGIPAAWGGWGETRAVRLTLPAPRRPDRTPPKARTRSSGCC